STCRHLAELSLLAGADHHSDCQSRAQCVVESLWEAPPVLLPQSAEIRFDSLASKPKLLFDLLPRKRRLAKSFSLRAQRIFQIEFVFLRFEQQRQAILQFDLFLAGERAHYFHQFLDCRSLHYSLLSPSFY